MLSTEKINALINLLDDPDLDVYTRVKDELLEIGKPIIPQLEHAWEGSFNAILQQRIENVLHEIQFQSARTDLQHWAQKPNPRLLEGSLIVAAYQYPDIDVFEVEQFIEKLTKDIWIELNSELTALEKVSVFNRVFFELYQFRGNKKNFHSPRNSFINHVIDSKKGSPISLSILYIEVARRLKIPIYGINLAEHFVLAYTKLPIEFLDGVNQEDVLFYINPFNRGAIFQYEDIVKYVAQLKLDLIQDFYLPCNNHTIIRRLLNNLLYSYQKSGDKDKQGEILSLLKAMEAGKA
tara:strand:- start:31 stop:909 length:879 start_codon:yes stop_codon:yes gene_type:complete